MPEWLSRLHEKLLPFLSMAADVNVPITSNTLEILVATMPILQWIVDMPTMDVRAAIVMNLNVRKQSL